MSKVGDDIPRDKFVQTIMASVKCDKVPRLLIGFVGDSTRPGCVRIFSTIFLTNYLDLDVASIVHRVKLSDSIDPFVRTYFWMRHSGILGNVRSYMNSSLLPIGGDPGDPMTVGDTCWRPSENLSCPYTPYFCSPTRASDCATNDVRCGHTEQYGACSTNSANCGTQDFNCPTGDVICGFPTQTPSCNTQQCGDVTRAHTQCCLTEIPCGPPRTRSNSCPPTSQIACNPTWSPCFQMPQWRAPY